MATNFYLEKRTDKQGDAPIRTSVAIKGVRLVTSTGSKIAPDKWDSSRQQVRRGCTNSAGITYNVINGTLAKIKEHFATFENECITKNYTPSVEDLKREISRAAGRRVKKAVADKAKQLTLYDYFDKFVADMGEANQWTKATHQKFATLKNHLTDFNASLSFADLSEDGLNGFVAFLREEKDLKNSTIGKIIGFLKWFLRWATSKGFNTNMAFQSFSPKLKTAARQVIFLEWKELMRVYNYTIPANGTEVKLRDSNGNEYTKTVHDAAALAKTRDLFCFCCFTSLRYSDAANLKHTHIDRNSKTMTITTIKTADTLTIELNKYAVSILERYKKNGMDDFVFPHITNQRMNLYLKELCEFCEINQPMTRTYYKGSQRIDETLPKYEFIGTHTGRRTFICNALTLGIPAEIVMKWTGHADYKSMKPYVAIADEAKAKAMQLFDKM